MLVPEITFDGLGRAVRTGKMVEDATAPMFHYTSGTPYQGVGAVWTFDGTTGEIKTLEKDKDNNPLEVIKQVKGKYTKAFVVLGSMVFPYSQTYDFMSAVKDTRSESGDMVYEGSPKQSGRAHVFGFWCDITKDGVFDFKANEQKEICLFTFKSFGVTNFERAMKDFLKTTATVKTGNVRMVVIPYAQKETKDAKNFNKLEFEVGMVNEHNGAAILEGIKKFEETEPMAFSLKELLQIRTTHEKMPVPYCKGICKIPAQIYDVFNEIILAKKDHPSGFYFHGSSALMEAVQGKYDISMLASNELPALDDIELPALPEAPRASIISDVTSVPADDLPF